MERCLARVVTGASIAVLLFLGPVGQARADSYDAKPGDTVITIARRFGVSYKDVIAANGLKEPYVIFQGQTLTIPGRSSGGGSRAKSGGASSAPASSAGGGSSGGRVNAGGYTVRAGDTVIGIAARAGVTASSIIAANGLRPPHVIMPGARLTIPAWTRENARTAAPARPAPAAGTAQATAPARPAPAAGTAQATAPAGNYTIRQGDTLWDLARKGGVPVGTLLAMNPGADKVLMPGQRIQVPASVASAAAASAPRPMAPVPAPVPRKEVKRSLDHWAAQYQVPRDLMSGVAWVESGQRQDVVSSAGAVGVMQLLPGTAEWLSSHVVKDRVDPASHDHNVRGGAAYLNWLLQKFGGDERLAVGSYFQGPGNTLESGLNETAENYVRKVADARSRF